MTRLLLAAALGMLLTGQVMAGAQAPLSPPLSAIEPAVQGWVARLFEAGKPVRSGQLVDAETLCPELGALSGTWGTWLPAAQQKPSVGQLVDLAQFLAESHQAPKRLGLDFAGLHALLAQVAIEPESPSLWDQFLRWLRARYGEHVKSVVQQLFERLGQYLPPGWVAVLLFKGVAAVLGVLLLVLVARGLAPLHHRLRWKPYSIVREPEKAHPAGRTAWAEIKTLPPLQLVAALLALVIDSLTQRGKIPPGRSRTIREIEKQLAAGNASLGNMFGRLGARAEPVLYGGCMPSQEEQEELFSIARAIVENTGPEGAVA
jgi:hypothetical protein